jgi:3'(2'), 5'-bisphosphate nucleotidase
MPDVFIDIMLRAALAAADAINTVYAGAFTAVAKADGSPVTEADQRAEAVILEHLAATGLPVLAEESVAAGRIPELGTRFFVVDPLDGTKEFLKRNGEFTVNIALVEDGRPVSGVVLAPASGATFSGGPEGAFSYQIEDGRPTGRRQIAVAPVHRPRVVASRSHGHQALAALCAALDAGEDVSVGSSLKFCLLAQGVAQLYPRFTPTSEWDTAAGHAVLEAAGGTLLTLEGTPLRYGKAETGYLNPFFVAAADRQLCRRAASEMERLMDEVSLA